MEQKVPSSSLRQWFSTQLPEALCSGDSRASPHLIKPMLLIAVIKPAITWIRSKESLNLNRAMSFQNWILDCPYGGSFVSSN